MWKLPVNYLCPLILMMVSPLPAWALCCPSVGQKPARSGIGEVQPSSADLSLDRRWKVHAFERDAVNYFQVADNTDSTLFILGKSGNVFWVLPAGPVDTQISLPSDERRPRVAEGSVEIYRDQEFKLLVSGNDQSPVWMVEYVTDAL